MMGANSAKVTVFGNLKYDALTANGSVDPALAEFLNAAQPLWIAASTTSGEEEHVLSAFAAVRRRHPRLPCVRPGERRVAGH